jgi:hypothetical protein
MEESCFFIFVNLNSLRANRYEQMEMYLLVHTGLKASLTGDFLGILIHEKNLKLKISCQTPFVKACNF